MRKGNKAGKFLLAALAGQLMFAAPIQASTLDKLQSQETSKTQEISELEETINEKLVVVNEKKAEVSNLLSQVEEIEAEKEQTIEEIAIQEELVLARKEQVQERLLALQTSPSTNNMILMLLEAEDFGEFINMLLIISQLQGADNERISAAVEAEEILKELETELAQELAASEEKTKRADEESKKLEQELSSLQTVLNDNQLELDRILAKKNSEENRLAEVARAEKAEAEKLAAQEAAKKEASEQEEATPTTEETTTVVEEQEPVTEPVKPAAKPVETSPASGQKIAVEATAYSRNEPGLTNFTATGIDLRSNSAVIAVDPSVIPLWSLVEVPGYGIYVAGDTGGAIIGNRIDIHMEDLGAVHAFGRQGMTVTVLN
ncbi:Cell wall-binding protein YocH [Jeotgalibaca dankookensis]|uniref:Cell wall-binding protein YocH n=1 Tax=Jeotgalibaca dankookensis TaxID=708126 RepID=A0A1S6IQB7_9LACT|nr:3D domain-containing protein [Jeotgalibaca dankookensis]AQS53660.1 Cell wall-binding protein YocH [Jeotgalibaca dankookensis]